MIVQTILGVDPGITGALGLIQLGGGFQFIDVADMPSEDVGKTTTIRRVNPERLAELIRHWSPTIVIVERVQPMQEKRGDDEERKHQMGTVGAFNYGHGCGVIEGVLRALGHRPVMVAPVSWKRAAGLIKKGTSYAERKRLSLALGRELWPDAPFERAGHSGRAESCLIARFGFSSQAKLI